MADTPDEHDDPPLSERFLDLFVFLPTGLAVTLAEELPRLAERGRQRLGVQVNSARAVGKFAVRAGGHEIRKRTEGRRGPSGSPGAGTAPPAPAPGASPRAASPTARAQEPTSPPRLRSIPRPPTTVPPTPAVTPAPVSPTPGPPAPTPAAAETPAAPPRPAGGHVPDVGSLAIPGFDTLSASQVVQRLDGLSRSELVEVRAYETSTRGRRTILNRVDQLLDERS